jgi:hypothetical protein
MPSFTLLENASAQAAVLPQYLFRRCFLSPSATSAAAAGRNATGRRKIGQVRGPARYRGQKYATQYLTSSHDKTHGRGDMSWIHRFGGNGGHEHGETAY